MKKPSQVQNWFHANIFSFSAKYHNLLKNTNPVVQSAPYNHQAQVKCNILTSQHCCWYVIFTFTFAPPTSFVLV